MHTTTGKALSTRAFYCLLAACALFMASNLTLADEWVLVRLERPLEQALPQGGFSPETGWPELDALLGRAGVEGIDHALPVSAKNPGRPDLWKRYGLDRTYRFRVPDSVDAASLCEELSQLPQVVYAEPDTRLLPLARNIPDDPLFPQQWGLDQDSDAAVPDADVDAPEAWDISVGDPSIIIAFIDSGVDMTHVEFPPNKLVPGWDFTNGDADPTDDHGHGTRVASIAAAATDNGVGIAGVCWECRVMPLKADFESFGADALVWATDNGARVVNISQHNDTHSQTLVSGIAYAYDAGVVVVASAGNANQTPIVYPARYPETIAVGATDSSDWRVEPFSCSFTGGSSYGPALDVVAPGDSIVAANNDGGYATPLCGTSLSSPLVAGLVGLMESVNPALGREEARHLVRSGAEDQRSWPPDPDDVAGFDPYYGWGRVNMERTLQGAASSTTLRVEGTSATRVYLDSVPIADSYDFIRGDLGALEESWRGVDLGTVVCLENDSADPDLAGNEDTATPAPGEGFFYLARFNGAPGAGSYGGSSSNRDRSVMTADYDWAANDEAADTQFGRSVYSAGDVNGDGYDDVIVGASKHTQNYSSEGAAFLYLGSPSGLQSSPSWSAYGGQAGAEFGFSVATAGDVNDDGYDDVIIGACSYDGDAVDEGRAYVYLGSAEGLAATPVWQADDALQYGYFGFRVRTAGDVNSDGHDDVIVAAARRDATAQGGAWVYLGSDTGVDDVASWSFTSGQSDARIWGVGTAGDVNSDGYSDVVVGAPLYTNGQSDEGRAWLFLGSAAGLSPTPVQTLEIDSAGAHFGDATITAGDVNCDGYDDVIIPANTYSDGQTEEGAAFVYYGNGSGVSTTADWIFETDQNDAYLFSAETAGDVNSDGCDDVIVSSTRYDGSRSDEGRLWLFLGSPAGLSETPAWSTSSGVSLSSFGYSIATAGDVNDDGNDDIIVGALLSGEAFVYYGPVGPSPTSDCDP